MALRDRRAQTGLGEKGLVFLFCLSLVTKAKMLDSFYARIDYGSSPPLWTLDPRLVIAGGRWASVE